MGNIESLLPGGFDSERELNDKTEPAQGDRSQFDRDLTLKISKVLKD